VTVLALSLYSFTIGPYPIGPYPIPVETVIGVFLHRAQLVDKTWSDAVELVILNIRGPRIRASLPPSRMPHSMSCSWDGVRICGSWEAPLQLTGISPWPPWSSLVLPMLYQDLFVDLDLAREVKGFYRDFFGHDLTDAQVTEIPSGTP
jgi:hypothetical protein